MQPTHLQTRRRECEMRSDGRRPAALALGQLQTTRILRKVPRPPHLRMARIETRRLILQTAAPAVAARLLKHRDPRSARTRRPRTYGVMRNAPLISRRPPQRLRPPDSPT